MKRETNLNFKIAHNLKVRTRKHFKTQNTMQTINPFFHKDVFILFCQKLEDLSNIWWYDFWNLWFYSVSRTLSSNIAMQCSFWKKWANVTIGFFTTFSLLRRTWNRLNLFTIFICYKKINLIFFSKLEEEDFE